MKTPLLALPLLIAASLATAQAATSGTLTVRGQIDGGTCNLSTIANVTLPPVKVSDFDSSTWTGLREFSLEASCDSDIRNVTFMFTGTPASGSPTYWASTGTAGGIASVLQARNGPNYNIPANGTAAQRQRTVATSAGKATLPMAAHYMKVGTVSKGTLVTTATVSITYL
ncbi:fimbrial protein [Pseudomonas vanderleydeniana]|uniref:Fimbrial protein n=1 Tax=Pseudomonas vanderleydeniana TaxID=2745495 RepID=A0A9E6TRB6_9PSED|nr:fimbrial protein [Pseudomonas vanderleydeniana]QXI28393.1 fimbrial protein [Pseudomonas vanderleydeniana]